MRTSWRIFTIFGIEIRIDSKLDPYLRPDHVGPRRTLFFQPVCLLANSIVQDGHGMLPLLAYTIKDSILIKVFNYMIGLGIGVSFYFVGF
jgi:hypothetical protein